MAVPPLSIVMPVLNARAWLDAAVSDLLGQSFGDFELVVRDDGSNDGSAELLRDWAARDKRIRLFLGETRLGPAASSQFVVEQARAPLVARMDADDRALPTRIEKQMAALAAHADAVLVGALGPVIDGEGRTVRAADMGRLLRATPLAPFHHSSILFRREAFDQAGGYRAAAAKWEDIDLYLRMSRLGRLLVLAEPLCPIRIGPGSSRLADGQDGLEAAMDLMLNYAQAFARGEDAEATLAAGPGRRLRPEAFVASGAVALWAGRRPHILGRLLRRGRLRPARAAIHALLWAAWAEASPRSLRALLKARLAIRNRRARRQVAGRGVFEWRPGRPARPV